MAHISFDIKPIVRSDRAYPRSVYERVIRALKSVLLSEVALILLSKMRMVTANWEHKPNFAVRLMRYGEQSDEIEALYGLPSIHTLSDKIYTYVTSGVGARSIHPRGRWLLRVRGGRGGYMPKTRPGGYYGGSGKYDMSRTFYTPRVRWPGIQARDFESHIARRTSSDVLRTLKGAVSLAVG